MPRRHVPCFPRLVSIIMNGLSWSTAVVDIHEDIRSFIHRIPLTLWLERIMRHAWVSGKIKMRVCHQFILPSQNWSKWTHCCRHSWVFVSVLQWSGWKKSFQRHYFFWSIGLLTPTHVNVKQEFCLNRLTSRHALTTFRQTKMWYRIYFTTTY